MCDGGGNNCALVSFIIAFYNETEDRARESIESALNQTYRNIQIIPVLDDPDNAELRALITRYADSNDTIAPVFNSANMGAARSRNAGAEKADGDYIAIMDGDDISFPQRIEEELSVLIAGNLDLVAANTVAIDEQGQKLPPGGRRKIENKELRVVLPRANPIQHSTVLMKTSLFRELGGYRDIEAEDYDLWLRFLTAGAKMQIMSTPLVYYIIRSAGLTQSDTMLQYAGAKYSVKLYRERVAKGTDDYSDANKREFFTGFGYYDLAKRKSFNKNYRRLNDAITDLRAKRSINTLLGVLKAAMKSRKIMKWFVGSVYGVLVWRRYSDVTEK
jgi:glycosyltransferase involved in cell wall biosynthesis